MTLEEKYYEINRRLKAYLLSVGIQSKLLKFGVDVAQLNQNLNDTQRIRYPYFQTGIVGEPKQNSWTTEAGGVLTLFDYQMNFYTGPENDYKKDAALFYPFNVAKNALADVRLNLLNGVATILRTSGPYQWQVVSGQGVPSAYVLYKMRAVCSYDATIQPARESVDISDAVQIEAV